MSITLTNPLLVAFNGVTQENDTVGAVVSLDVDYLANVATYKFATGALLNGNLNPGTYGKTVLVTLNLTTGAWTDYNGHSGVLSGVAFTNLVAQLKGDRNQAETFAAGASGILPGTQVAW